MVEFCESFASIQGEGINAGIVCIFVRFAKCNMHCTKATVGFDCDTPYSFTGIEKPIEQVCEDVGKLCKENKCKHICITGGEPLLNQDAMIALINYLKNNKLAYYFEVETNGTILPNKKLTSVVNLWNVSPKKDFLEVVKNWDRNVSGQVFFKFVIESPEKLELLKDIKSHTHYWVGFMPEGYDRETSIKNSIWLVEECKKLNIRFCPRLQIILYGNKRAV